MRAFFASAVMAGFFMVSSIGLAQAKTCFHVCLAAKLKSDKVSDDDIRGFMENCRNFCERETKASIAGTQIATKIKTCEPKRVSEKEMHKVRGESASFLSYAGAFTWDVTNPLADKVIMKIEMITQNMYLQDVVMSSAGTVLPGKTETLLIDSSPGGNPSLSVTTRIKAIYACPVS